MKHIMTLGSIVLFFAASAAAQTSGATSQPNAPPTASTGAKQSVTMTGCVGALSGSTGGFMLSNPVVIPNSAEAATPTGSIARTPSTSDTQPATGTAEVGSAAGTPGTIGTSGTSSTPGTSGMNGYRLSGSDMSSWSGQRVQIVGVVVPATKGSTANAGTGASGATLPEFRVQSVTPVSGGCAKQ